MTKLTSIVLAITTFFTSLFGFFISPEAPDDTSEFTPVLRFIAASDSHVQFIGDSNSRRMQKAFKLAYDLAEEDEEYNSLDAAMFAGDLTNGGMTMQFIGYKTAVDAVIKDETKLLTIAAKSHDSSAKGNHKMLPYYTELMETESNFHTVINGFHFLGISVSATEGEHYSQYQREWLRAELDKAVAEDPNKPVFVMHHEHVANTVYGSSDFEGWGNDYFKDIFAQYPQVVHFSGHSHYPLNDPRSIWQGEFTAIGTGALYYVELTVDDTRTVNPDGHKNVSTFWIVEVDASNNIRLRGIDLMAEEVIVEYILKNPANTANRDYTPEKRIALSKAPAFDNGAALEVKKLFGNYTVTAPAAKSTDGMAIFIYRAYVYDAEGNMIAEAKTLNDYYVAHPSETIEIELGKLPEGAVKVSVIAENCYGIQSAPIEYNF